MGIKTRKLDTVRTPVLTAYNNGVSMDAIADAHKVSKGTVRNLLLAEGVNLRKQGRPKNSGNKPIIVKEIN
jgi:orotate phosphoribosyltransferase-like protein